MEPDGIRIKILKQCLVSSLLGLIAFIFSLVLLIVGYTSADSFIPIIVMSLFCSLTSMMGRRAATLQMGAAASRYSSWSLINLIVWATLGLFATVWQLFWLSWINASAASYTIIILIWLAIYGAGLRLFVTYYRVAKEYRNTFVLMNANANVMYREPGYSPPGNPENYYPQSTGVYYAQPVYPNQNVPGFPQNPPMQGAYPNLAPANGGYAYGQPVPGNNFNQPPPGPGSSPVVPRNS
jgi:hypothetical protein